MKWVKFKSIVKKLGYEADGSNIMYKYIDEDDGSDNGVFKLIRITIHDDKVVFLENVNEYVHKEFKTFDDILSLILLLEK